MTKPTEPHDAPDTAPTPIAAGSTASEPAQDQPTVAESNESRSAAAEVAMSQPAGSKSSVSQPGVSKPGVTEPGVSMSGVAEPGVAESAVAESGVAKPVGSGPAAAVSDSGVTEPAVSEPAVEPLPAASEPGGRPERTDEPAAASTSPADGIRAAPERPTESGPGPAAQMQPAKPADVGGHVGNGQPEAPATSLPPPWQRVPAGANARATSAGSVRTNQHDLGRARTVAFNRPKPAPDAEPAEAPGGGQSGPASPPGGLPIGWPRNRRPRQAALQLKRLDPWSVLKIALVLAVVLYLVWLVAVGMLYGALDGIGVWERLNGQYSDLVADQAGDQLISASRVFGFASVIGAVNSLLFAVALSLGAFIYNVSADLVGGIEVTLSERD